MSKKFLSPIKLAQGATNPATGSSGELFFNTVDLKVYAHNGTTWAPSGGSLTMSATAPTSPTPMHGDAWIDTEDMSLNVFFVDASGAPGAWVQTPTTSAINATLASRMDVVEPKVTTLQSQVSGHTTDISTLQSRATAVENRATVLESRATALESKYLSPNYIINGAFDIWQRGTTFSSAGYTADRWTILADGSGATRAISQQTFTPGAAPVAGYEGTYFMRYNQSVAGSSATYNIIEQRIEDVRACAGQTVTISFWAKAAADINLTSQVQQNFGSGGSSEVQAINPVTVALTTSWQRFTYTAAMPTISAKTIGTNSYVAFRINLPTNAAFVIDVWGVQMELGSYATPFRRNANSIQAELAACQRYLQVQRSASSGEAFMVGASYLNVYFLGFYYFPVIMRASPTVSFSGSFTIDMSGTTSISASSIVGSASTTIARIFVTHGDNANFSGYKSTVLTSNSGNSISYSAEL